MEQAFSNVDLETTSDLYVNGGQSTSGSSSSCGTSYNGTPSHSSKDSATAIDETWLPHPPHSSDVREMGDGRTMMSDNRLPAEGTARMPATFDRKLFQSSNTAAFDGFSYGPNDGRTIPTGSTSIRPPSARSNETKNDGTSHPGDFSAAHFSSTQSDIRFQQHFGNEKAFHNSSYSSGIHPTSAAHNHSSGDGQAFSSSASNSDYISNRRANMFVQNSDHGNVFPGNASSNYNVQNPVDAFPRPGAKVVSSLNYSQIGSAESFSTHNLNDEIPDLGGVTKGNNSENVESVSSLQSQDTDSGIMSRSITSSSYNYHHNMSAISFPKQDSYNENTFPEEVAGYRQADQTSRSSDSKNQFPGVDVRSTSSNDRILDTSSNQNSNDGRAFSVNAVAYSSIKPPSSDTENRVASVHDSASSFINTFSNQNSSVVDSLNRNLDNDKRFPGDALANSSGVRTNTYFDQHLNDGREFVGNVSNRPDLSGRNSNGDNHFVGDDPSTSSSITRPLNTFSIENSNDGIRAERPIDPSGRNMDNEPRFNSSNTRSDAFFSKGQPSSGDITSSNQNPLNKSTSSFFSQHLEDNACSNPGSQKPSPFPTFESNNERPSSGGNTSSHYAHTQSAYTAGIQGMTDGKLIPNSSANVSRVSPFQLPSAPSQVAPPVSNVSAFFQTSNAPSGGSKISFESDATKSSNPINPSTTSQNQKPFANASPYISSFQTPMQIQSTNVQLPQNPSDFAPQTFKEYKSPEHPSTPQNNFAQFTNKVTPLSAVFPSAPHQETAKPAPQSHPVESLDGKQHKIFPQAVLFREPVQQPVQSSSQAIPPVVQTRVFQDPMQQRTQSNIQYRQSTVAPNQSHTQQSQSVPLTSPPFTMMNLPRTAPIQPAFQSNIQQHVQNTPRITPTYPPPKNYRSIPPPALANSYQSTAVYANQSSQHLVDQPGSNAYFSTSQQSPPTSSPLQQMPQQPFLASGTHQEMRQPTSYSMNGPVSGQRQTPNQIPPHASIPPQTRSQYPSGQYQSNDAYQQQQQSQQRVDSVSRQFNDLSVTRQGSSYYGMRGIEHYDLLRMRDVLPKEKIQPPRIQIPPEVSNVQCRPDVFRCSLTQIPETKSLLDKSRLPFGILIHPFRDLKDLCIIKSQVIERCRSCRSYLNPYVFFIDSRHWKCNLCYRLNELSEGYQHGRILDADESMGRPELKHATVEYLATQDYMIRPPQPAIYLFLMDVSRAAVQSGYLSTMCSVLLSNLEKLPRDARTAVGFIAFDSAVRFYNLGDNVSQPNEMIITDVDDIFIPYPENLIVNLHEQKQLIEYFLQQLPEKFKETNDTNCALGSALQAGYKMLALYGGRVTVFLSSLPNHGPGALKMREDPAAHHSDKGVNLRPATDFYKKLALECCSQHIAVDLFVMNAQYVDLASISGISQISAGCIHHFPRYSVENRKEVEKFKITFERYLLRKIGFEAVMRLRCTKGLSIHSFHGNFFVRTTDLLALPNVNPDAGIGMQVCINENLIDVRSVCFQAAVLYTSSKGKRRVRVHTICLPVSNNLNDILVSADQQCIIGLLAKMAVDRSQESSVSDAREAFMNTVCDVLTSYKNVQPGLTQSGSIVAPNNLYLLPLYVSAILKNVAFRISQNTRTDDRIFAMYQMKCTPLDTLMQIIHPDLYPVHHVGKLPEPVDNQIQMPPLLQLSAERVDSTGVYLMDQGDAIILFIGHNIPIDVCQQLFGYPNFSTIPENLDELPEVDSQANEYLNMIITVLQNMKSYPVVLHIIKDNSPERIRFYERLIEDKTEAGSSYYEFLQNLRVQMS